MLSLSLSLSLSLQLQMQKDRNRERAAWMEQIIREEQMKPLEVNTHFVKEYEKKEKMADAALERTIEHHLHNLRKLKESIEAKDKIRQRKEKFYAKREEVRERLRQRAAGKTKNGNGKKQQQNPGSSGSPTSGSPGAGAGAGAGPETTSGPPSQAGTDEGSRTKLAMELTVGSLDKLLQLEKRINVLEKNVQEKAKMEQRTAGSLSQLGMLRFRKKKIEASLRSPAQTRFSVSMHPGNNPTNPANNNGEEEEELDGQAKVSKLQVLFSFFFSGWCQGLF